MRLIVGTLIVFACVFGSYAAMGGHLLVLWQPFEFVIILGAAIGAFVIGNTGPVLKAVPAMLGTLVKGPKYNQQSYVELLGMQYSLYKLAKLEGFDGARAAHRKSGRVVAVQRLPDLRGEPSRGRVRLRLHAHGDAGRQQRPRDRRADG
ncbi:motility-associated protein [Methylobacterium oryzae CBMB20]